MKMTGLCFIDTNILVYAHDGRERRKQRIAVQLVEDLAEKHSAVISSQVIQEFCNVVLKPDISLSQSVILETLRRVFYPMLRHTPSFDFYERVLELLEGEQLGFYDALIVQAAIDLGCKTLYSEDLQAGRSYQGVTVEDPFLSITL